MMRKNKIAPSPHGFLNGWRMRRISGFKPENFGIRFVSVNVASLCGRKTEVCEELRKKRVDVCCIQEIRWKGQEARFVVTSGQRYKLWWLENDAEFEGVGILVKEEISENIVVVGRKSNRVMAIVPTLSREIIRIICALGHSAEDQIQRKLVFMMKWRASVSPMGLRKF